MDQSADINTTASDTTAAVCLICNRNSQLVNSTTHSDSDGSRRTCSAYQVLTLLLSYPNNFTNRPTVTKMELMELHEASSIPVRQPLKATISFCPECEGQLLVIHRALIEAQVDVAQRIQTTLTTHQAAGKDDDESVLVRRQLLSELNCQVGKATPSQAQQRSGSPSAIPECYVRLHRLALKSENEAAKRPLDVQREIEPSAAMSNWAAPLVIMKEEAEAVDWLYDEDDLPMPAQSPSHFSPAAASESNSEEISRPVPRKSKKTRRSGRPRRVRRTDEETAEQATEIGRRRRERHRKCEFPECDFTSVRWTQLACHVLSHHFRAPDGIFLCPKCGQFFPSQREALDQHLEAHAAKESIRFPCSHCTATSFVTFSNLVAHCRQKHPTLPRPTTNGRKAKTEKRFQCSRCTHAFICYANLRAHCGRVHPDQPMPSRTGFPPVMRKNRKADGGGDLLKCPFCPKVYSSDRKQGLKSHVTSHTKPHKCKVEGCNAEFSTALSLRCHSAQAHPELGQLDIGLLCSHCPFRTNRSEALTAHVRAKHETHLTVPCTVPGCSFRTPNACRLRQHMEKVHEGKKDFLCPECGHAFYLDSQLRRHLQTTHSAVKPFSCSICGKLFKWKQKMHSHELTHGTARPFQCTLCGVRFPTKNNLNGHRLSWHKGGTERIGVRPTRKSKYDDDDDNVKCGHTPA